MATDSLEQTVACEGHVAIEAVRAGRPAGVVRVIPQRGFISQRIVALQTRFV